MQGFVKWFDPSKGFGFVVADGGGPDILLHANVLRNFGQSSIADQAVISIMVQETERGVQATEVLQIDAPVAEVDAQINGNGDQVIDDVSQPLEPARVKWFDKSKGFGFANIFGRPEDVFVHIDVLRRSGLADLQAGEAICIRVADGERGRMATSVSSWEAIVRDQL